MTKTKLTFNYIVDGFFDFAARMASTSSFALKKQPIMLLVAAINPTEWTVLQYLMSMMTGVILAVLKII